MVERQLKTQLRAPEDILTYGTLQQHPNLIDATAFDTKVGFRSCQASAPLAHARGFVTVA